MHDALFGNANASRTGLSLKALDYERSHKRKQARALRTPEEILTMPHNQALVMASGYGIPPFLAEKVPYCALRSYRGLFAPNPYFDRDLSKVLVPAWVGREPQLAGDHRAGPIKPCPSAAIPEWPVELHPVASPPDLIRNRTLRGGQ